MNEDNMIYIGYLYYWWLDIILLRVMISDGLKRRRDDSSRSKQHKTIKNPNEDYLPLPIRP